MTSISAVNPLVFAEKESSFDRGLCTYRDFDSPSSKHPSHTVRVEKITYLRKHVSWGDFFSYAPGKMYLCIFVVFVVIILAF